MNYNKICACRQNFAHCENNQIWKCVCAGIKCINCMPTLNFLEQFDELLNGTTQQVQNVG